jgi:uncharacterized membrane protein HdeD (DUF308 family)
MIMNEMGSASVLIGAVTRNWWLILVRGLAAIIFGIACFVWPAISLLALVLLWGVYALVDGVGAIVWGAQSRWWSMAVVGAVSVLAGLIAFAWPGITALALLYLIAAWAVVRGIAEIVAAIRLRRQIHNEWILIVGGLVSVLFGVLVALFPGAGALSLVWVIGAFALVFGVSAVALSWRLRSVRRKMHVRREEVPVGAAGRARTPDDVLP